MLALALTLLAALAAQDADAPPPLDAAKKEKLERAIKGLRAPGAEARAERRKEIEALGRAAIPELVAACHTPYPEQQESLTLCLVALADERDKGLVADTLSATEPAQVPLRRFAVRKAGELGGDELLELLPRYLADEDAEVRLHTALALAYNGREDGLPVLAKAWAPETQQLTKDALAGLKDHGKHEPLAALLKVDKEREKLDPAGAAAERRAAVSMLRAIGDEQAVVLIASALDDSHNLVQRDAIDALRELIEQKGAFVGASIFEQINEIKRLKEVVTLHRNLKSRG